MIRKILYSLIAISFVIIINQIVSPGGATATNTTGPTSTSPSIAAGTVEVRILSSAVGAEVTSAKLAVSGVEIHTNDGWANMTMGSTNTVDLKQTKGSETTIATKTDLSQGTYTTIRLSIASLDVAVGGNPTKKAKLSANRLTFSQNFQVTAKNTTVLVFYFDAINAIDYSVKDQIIFKPYVNLLFTRTPGSMELIYTAVPQGEVGVAYNTQLIAIGGQAPYSWSITAGDLPTGLKLDPDTGIISGMPAASGNFNFMARADDASANRKNTSRNYAVGIAVEGDLQIVGARLPDGAEKIAYSATLQAIGSRGPYSWSLSGNLPPGLKMDAKLGIISGTATAKGDYSFVINVMDSANPVHTDAQTVNIHIAPELVLG